MKKMLIFAAAMPRRGSLLYKRLMLVVCLAALCAQAKPRRHPAYEPDGNPVSGKAAQKIGIKLREISRSRQVLCVTHLSQIAVMADTQFMIEKHDENDRTVTQVHLLDFEGRVQEIARIMGGDHPSELMLENAREELKRVQEGNANGTA